MRMNYAARHIIDIYSCTYRTCNYSYFTGAYMFRWMILGIASLLFSHPVFAQEDQTEAARLLMFTEPDKAIEMFTQNGGFQDRAYLALLYATAVSYTHLRAHET